MPAIVVRLLILNNLIHNYIDIYRSLSISNAILRVLISISIFHCYYKKEYLIMLFFNVSALL